MGSVYIKNGRLVDPSQGIDGMVDLLVRDGKVAALIPADPTGSAGSARSAAATAEAGADSVIDAAGKIVSPGFIDMHMHEDPYIKDEKGRNTGRLASGMAESMVLMGVTTEVAGNCGDNFGEPDKYMDDVDAQGTAANVALLAGHTFLRHMANPESNRYMPVTSDELKKMKYYAQKYISAGCMGVSFGIKYVPGATWNELAAITALCHEKDLIASAHVRNDVGGVFAGGAELALLGRECGVRTEFSHIGSMGGYGQMEKLLQDVEGYRKSGVDIMCDCYPYDAFSTKIGETTYDDGFLEAYDAGYDSVRICSGKYAGMRCTKEIFDELRAERPETETIGYFMKSDDISMALMCPFVMIGSDGVREGDQGHPRAAGTFPKFFKDYVSSGRISISEGIKKMTAMAAERLHLPAKGNLRVGSDADIVIFDADNIRDCATYDQPTLPPEGIDFVLIGGQIAAENGKLVNGHLGRSIRS